MAVVKRGRDRIGSFLYKQGAPFHCPAPPHKPFHSYDHLLPHALRTCDTAPPRRCARGQELSQASRVEASGSRRKCNSPASTGSLALWNDVAFAERESKAEGR